MKRKGFLVLAGVMCLAVIIGGMPFMAACAKPAPGPITIKAVSFMPKNHSLNDTYRWFIDQVNEKAKGELLIDFLGGPEVIPGDEQALAVTKGVVDLIHNPTSYYIPLVPEAAFTFPLSTLKPWEERESGFYDFILKKHEEAGMYYLGRGQVNVSFYIHTNVLVEKPEDLAGMQMRSSQVYDAFLKALGVAAVTMAIPDVYTALERGVVDGSPQPLNSFYDLKWHEVARYTVDHPFYGMTLAFTMSLNTWNRLSKSQQDLIMDVMLEHERYSWEYYGKQIAEYRQKMLDAGQEFIKFSSGGAKQYLDLAYSSGWEEQKRLTPEAYSKLRELLRVK